MPDFEFTLPEETVKEALQRWAKGHRMPLRRQAELLGVPESTLANAVNPHIDSCHYQLRHLLLRSRERRSVWRICRGSWRGRLRSLAMWCRLLVRRWRMG